MWLRFALLLACTDALVVYVTYENEEFDYVRSNTFDKDVRMWAARAHFTGDITAPDSDGFVHIRTSLHFGMDRHMWYLGGRGLWQIPGNFSVGCSDYLGVTINKQYRWGSHRTI